MKSKFIYPTVKNSFIFFGCFQIMPIILSIFGNLSLSSLALLEIAGIGILFIWPLKPITEMDERELTLELKWKNRMFDSMATCLLIPIVLLLINPDSKGWVVLNSLSFPAFTFIVIFSILKRKDLGYIFANPISSKK